MNKLIPFLLLLLITSTGFTQVKSPLKPQISLDIKSYASTGNDLPFWFTSNQRGAISQTNSTYQLGQLQLTRAFEAKNTGFDFSYGTSLIYGYGENSQKQINQYFAGIRFKKITLSLGAQSDSIRYGGLSSTNGNMFASNNARPIPGIKISSYKWISTPLLGKYLFFRFAFEEQLLDNDRLVQHAHLHHKNLYFRYHKNGWKISGGIEHYAFWGGVHPTQGQLPEDFSGYLRSITGLSGGSNAPVMDQINAAGNQEGTYILEIEKQFKNSSLHFYWNHLFDDRSGMEMQNWRDGLWGLHWKKEKGFLTDILYEFMYTKHQSGSYHLIPDPDHEGKRTGRGKDNYFNHNIYSSGLVSKGRMAGTPLFIPISDANGISTGYASTRMWMHHFGVKGILFSDLYWKGLINYSRNFGTYNTPYNKPLNQFSFLVEFNYKRKQLPFEVNCGISGDYGDRFENRTGIYLGINRKF